MSLRIPLAKPEITDADRAAVLAVLDTSSLSMGPKLGEFEQALASYIGRGYAVAVNSGSSALHLAFETLALPVGSEVILPSFAFAAPLNVILQKGLTPVFVDIEPETLNSTPEQIEAAITPQTKAIIAIHTFGRPLAIEKIRAIADRHGLYLIEDACEALGAEIHGGKAGSFGDIGIFAFYPNKQITTGEGGVFLASRQDLADHARRLRNQGRDASLDWYQQSEIGFSYRLPDINCALGLSQLRRIESILERRRAIASTYEKRLGAIADIQTPSLTSDHGTISWFCYVIQLAKNFTREHRDLLCTRLAQLGIGAGRYFAPLHRQPVVANDDRKWDLPVTDFVADRVLALPFFNQLADPEIEVAASALEQSLAELRRRKT